MENKAIPVNFHTLCAMFTIIQLEITKGFRWIYKHLDFKARFENLKVDLGGKV